MDVAAVDLRLDVLVVVDACDHGMGRAAGEALQQLDTGAMMPRPAPASARCPAASSVLAAAPRRATGYHAARLDGRAALQRPKADPAGAPVCLSGSIGSAMRKAAKAPGQKLPDAAQDT